MYAKFLSLNQETRNKITAVVLFFCVLLSVFYWYSYRPMLIKKECATVDTYSSWEYSNSKYNEIVERQKRQQLGKYIQCRNNNLAEGNRLDVSPETLHSFTQAQYETLSLHNLTQVVLSGRPSSLYTVYFNGYVGGAITNDWYSQLQDNQDKYPQCDFPQEFVQEKISVNNRGSRNASDGEHKSCLRKQGVDD